MSNYSDLQFYVCELYERFLLSRKTPTCFEEELEIKKITSFLSILLWISQSNFCLENEGLILESVKELYENFKQRELLEKITEIVQKIKNINEKTKLQTQILETFVELEEKGCLDKRIKYPLDQHSLNIKFYEIIKYIHSFQGTSLIELMKLERGLKEIKQKYTKGFFKKEEIEDMFNSLINKGKFGNP